MIIIQSIGVLLCLVLMCGFAAAIPWAIRADRLQKPGRVWFWKPQWHWFGWSTLIPVTYGHDEYARRVLVFGWTVTGRILIAVWGCGDPECEADAAADMYHMLHRPNSNCPDCEES